MLRGCSIFVQSHHIYSNMSNDLFMSQKKTINGTGRVRDRDKAFIWPSICHRANLDVVLSFCMYRIIKKTFFYVVGRLNVSHKSPHPFISTAKKLMGIYEMLCFSCVSPLCILFLFFLYLAFCPNFIVYFLLTFWQQKIIWFILFMWMSKNWFESSWPKVDFFGTVIDTKWIAKHQNERKRKKLNFKIEKITLII